MKKTSETFIVNDVSERMGRLVGLRLPWLVLGALGGIVASIFVSRFEGLLSEEISLAFFVPIIVYMSDAVGTQTETIFVRYIKDHKVNLSKYLARELKIGICMGLVLGLLIGILVKLWLGANRVALTVGLAMGINVVVAPIVATTIAAILSTRRTDPALGAGPFATVIQDFISLVVYFLVAWVIFEKLG